jgi:Tfp pilus assembly protein PilX
MTEIHFYPKLMQDKTQKGVVLITALIILVIMTMLGLAGVRLSTQEEHYGKQKPQLRLSSPSL